MQGVLDVRVYRAAFIPALIAVFIVAFSLQGRPDPVRTRAVADAFDPSRAYGSARASGSLVELGAAFPERSPGSAGDAALADRVGRSLRAAGFDVSSSTTSGRTVEGERELETVVGVRPGLSSRRLVVLTHRDATSSPALAELSGTAALLELARIFRTRDTSAEAEAEERPDAPRRLVGRDLRKTLVLVSTSGGSGGDAGARAWARAQDPRTIDAVLVLGDLASAEWHKPWVVPWSNGRDTPPIGLERTVAVALRQETGSDPGGARASAQWSRRALPLTVSEQGEVNRAGLPAVLLQISGERGPAARAPVSREQFTRVGRGALRAILALDEAGRGGVAGQGRAAFAGETDGIVTVRNLLPTWSVRLIVLCLLLPALLAALDAFFRARRQHLAAGVWVGWVLAAGLAVPVAWAWLRILGITGALPAPRAPVLPADLPLTTAQAAALASVALGIALGVLIARLLNRGGRRARGNPAAGAAGAAVGVVICAVALAVWVVNPYAAALLVPAAHLWLFARRAADAAARRLGLARARGRPRAAARGPGGRARRAPDRAVLARPSVAAGHGRRARLRLVRHRAGRRRGLRRRARPRAARAPQARRVAPPGERPKTRGPATYAGPGSLGGTESALRR